jgi:hypothetical protein
MCGAGGMGGRGDERLERSPADISDGFSMLVPLVPHDQRDERLERSPADISDGFSMLVPLVPHDQRAACTSR